MSKTAYEIESELKGSAADRTGFGGRPELINFYVDASASPVDISMMPQLDKLDIDAFRCGKIIPVLTLADGNGGSATCVCIASVEVSNGDVTSVVITDADNDTLTYTVATKTWAFVAGE